jgi:hypothetical protein
MQRLCEQAGHIYQATAPNGAVPEAMAATRFLLADPVSVPLNQTGTKRKKINVHFVFFPSAPEAGCCFSSREE